KIPGAAGLPGFQSARNHTPGLFTDHKTVTPYVERARGARRVVVAGREGAHGRKSADRHRSDCAFAAAADHRHGVATLNDLEAIADGVRARAASGRGGRIRAFGVVVDRDISRSQVDDRGGNEKGRDAAGAAFHHLSMFALEDTKTPDAAADVYAHVFGKIVSDLQAGIIEGLFRGRDGEVDEIVHLLQLF